MIQVFRHRSLIAAIFAVTLIFVPATVAFAQSDQPPKPVDGPRLNPPAIPHTNVLTNLANIPLPVQSLEAAAADNRAQEAPGRGIRQTQSAVGSGITLAPVADACNDFNRRGRWQAPQDTDIFTDWYSGWAPFAVDDGYYQARNVVFARERVVGPGKNYGLDAERIERLAAKISSYQPYAAGFGSPLIDVKPGATVTVTVKYLIYDHGGAHHDWVSLGVKPDATGPVATYVNGYRRGEWATLTQVLKAGPTGQVMVLLQGHSPAALNSNVYFDNVQIVINAKPRSNCHRESE